MKLTKTSKFEDRFDHYNRWELTKNNSPTIIFKAIKLKSDSISNDFNLLDKYLEDIRNTYDSLGDYKYFPQKYYDFRSRKQIKSYHKRVNLILRLLEKSRISISNLLKADLKYYHKDMRMIRSISMYIEVNDEIQSMIYNLRLEKRIPKM